MVAQITTDQGRRLGAERAFSLGNEMLGKGYIRTARESFIVASKEGKEEASTATDSASHARLIHIVEESDRILSGQPFKRTLRE